MLWPRDSPRLPFRCDDGLRCSPQPASLDGDATLGDLLGDDAQPILLSYSEHRLTHTATKRRLSEPAPPPRVWAASPKPNEPLGAPGNPKTHKSPLDPERRLVAWVPRLAHDLVGAIPSGNDDSYVGLNAACPQMRYVRKTYCSTGFCSSFNNESRQVHFQASQVNSQGPIDQSI